MTLPETSPEGQAPPPAPAVGPALTVPEALPSWRQLPFFALLPVVSFFSILVMHADLFLAILFSGLVAGVYWFAFLRLNPRMVGLALIPIILVPYYAWADRMPDIIYATLWMAASALAGGVGAWLTRRREMREDDMILIPPAACALAFLVLIWLGTGAQTDTALNRAHEKLKAYPTNFIASMEAEPELRAMLTPEYREAMNSITPLSLTATLAVLWALGLWIFGRLARRLAGCVEGPRAALILLRIAPRYIFLLIAALGLGILGSLPGGGWLLYIAAPVLLILATAFAMVGLGIGIFFAALRRATGEPTRGAILLGATFAALLLLPQVLVIVGLVDHWFDYRRLGRIATLQPEQND